MKVNFYTSIREYNEKKNEFLSAIETVLENGITTLGKEVSEFESYVQEYTGAKYAIGVASGSDALVIASDILGFKEGKEVLTSPFTFLASASCLARNGSKPVFVDIDEVTLNIDANKIEDKITDKTMGILPIHLFTQMADMDKIMDLSKKYNLRILEDAAEAFGMRWKGAGTEYKHSGTLGDFGIFSFFPTKTLGAYGDGGMIVTNDEALAKLAKIYRVHGASAKYHYDYVGYNSRLDTLQAAVLNVKLKYIDASIKKREEIKERYCKGLKSCSNIKLPIVEGNQLSVPYVFNILCDNRDELQAYLKKNDIQTAIYYPVPLHLQNCFKYLGYKKGDFPVAERTCERILALPIYPELQDDEIDYVTEKIVKFYSNAI